MYFNIIPYILNIMQPYIRLWKTDGKKLKLAQRSIILMCFHALSVIFFLFIGFEFCFIQLQI